MYHFFSKIRFSSIYFKVFILLLSLSLTSFPTVVSALSAAQKRLISSGIPYFNIDDTATSCSLSGTTIAGVTVANGGTWQSGILPPYILEQFAIETLKDVAKKLNVDEKSAVTEEHVVGLLAFMGGEGGDIANNDIYNPLNTGIDDPTLVAGAHASDGTQSFKSFDAGVEGTARTIVKPQYSRLGAILTNPSSTAEEFMTILTKFQNYPGNIAWAEASDPKSIHYQPGYYAEHLRLVSDLKSNYSRLAGLIIGTPQFEQPLNIRDDTKIFFHPAGSASTASTNVGEAASSGCGTDVNGSIVANDIAKTAVNLSWPEAYGSATAEPGRSGPLTPTPAYSAAVIKYNPIGANASAKGADCGVFVATVLRATGADPNYPLIGTLTQADYVKQHPEKYDVVDHVEKTSDLKNGDIMIVNGSGADGHTFIFVGLQSNGNDIASASLDERMPNLDKSYVKDNRGFYTRARLKA